MRLGPYTTRATLLHARNDAMVPLAHGEQLAALGKNAKLVVLDAGSHMLPLSHPREVARHLFASPSSL
jgi:pimeloyl-ACP methyl ester carboxylesterase